MQNLFRSCRCRPSAHIHGHPYMRKPPLALLSLFALFVYVPVYLLTYVVFSRYIIHLMNDPLLCAALTRTTDCLQVYTSASDDAFLDKEGGMGGGGDGVSYPFELPGVRCNFKPMHPLSLPLLSSPPLDLSSYPSSLPALSLRLFTPSLILLSHPHSFPSSRISPLFARYLFVSSLPHPLSTSPPVLLSCLPLLSSSRPLSLILILSPPLLSSRILSYPLLTSLPRLYVPTYLSFPLFPSSLSLLSFCLFTSPFLFLSLPHTLLPSHLTPLFALSPIRIAHFLPFSLNLTRRPLPYSYGVFSRVSSHITSHDLVATMLDASHSDFTVRELSVFSPVA